jgi:N-acylglucosamine-6-phosphate 2-epimerase
MVAISQVKLEYKLVTDVLRTDNLESPIWDRFKGGLIISCQAPVGSAIDDPVFIRAQALTVEAAGARAIRAEGIANIRAVADAVSVPVIGLIKVRSSQSNVYITPRLEDVLAVVEAGADIVAVDATNRIRWSNQTLQEFYELVRKETDIPLLGDIDSILNAAIAIEMGFDAIATTLSGYTDVENFEFPNIELVGKIAHNIKVPVVAEGGFSTPEQVQNALAKGAWAVCVGTAITNPYELTKKFLA